MRILIFTFIFLAFNCPRLIAQERPPIFYTNMNFLAKVTSDEPIEYSFKVYQLLTQTYGYVIFANGEKYLHQPNMPGKALTEGFQSEQDAKKVAELVIRKLEFASVPPKASTREMQYLGIK